MLRLKSKGMVYNRELKMKIFFKKKLYKGNKRSYNGKAVEKRGKMKKGEENFFQKLLDRAKGSVID